MELTNLVAQESIKVQGLWTDCLPNVHLPADRGEWSSIQIGDSPWFCASSLPTVIGSQDLYYCYKLVTTKIPLVAGLAPIPYPGRKILPHR